MYRAHREQILPFSARQTMHLDYFIAMSKKTEHSELSLLCLQITPEAVSILAPYKGECNFGHAPLSCWFYLVSG